MAAATEHALEGRVNEARAVLEASWNQLALDADDQADDLGDVAVAAVGRQGDAILPLIEQARRLTTDLELRDIFDLMTSALLMLSGDYERAEIICDHLLARGHLVATHVSLQAAGNRALLFMIRGAMAAAEAVLPSIEAMDALGPAPEAHEARWQVRYLHARLLVQRGHWAAAERLAREAIDRFSAGLMPHQRALTWAFLSGCRVDADDPEGAAALAARAREEAGNISAARTALAMLRLLEAEGDLRAVWDRFTTDETTDESMLRRLRHTFLDLREEFLALHDGMSAAYASIQLTDIALLSDDEDLFHDAIAWAKAVDPKHPAIRLQVHQQWAKVAALCDDDHEQMRHLKQVVRAAMELGSFDEAAEAWAELAELTREDPVSLRYACKAMEVQGRALLVAEGEQDRLDFLARWRAIGATYVRQALRFGGPTEGLLAAVRVKSREFLRLVADRGREQGRRQATTPNTRLSGERRASSPRSVQDRADVESVYRELTRAAGLRREVRVRVQDLFAGVPAGGMGIEYFLDDPTGGALTLFVMSGGRVRAIESVWTAGHADLLGQITDFMRLRFGTGSATAARWLQGALRDLWDVLLAPVAQDLPHNETLVLAPGAMLNAVPFEILLDPEGRLLWEMADLRFRVGAPVLRRTAPKPRRRREALLLQGGDEGQGSGAPATNGLPHADREHRGLEERLRQRGWHVRVMDAADPTGLRAVARADLIHFAGHATFATDHGMSSRLALHSGGIRAVDILDWPLRRHPLVVLAGCDTGNAESRGDEFVGFVRSVLGAGAGALVASTRPAHDEAAAHLVAAFYDAWLAGDEPHRALALAARRVRGMAGFAHPFFWSGFRCFGVG